MLIAISKDRLRPIWANTRRATVLLTFFSFFIVMLIRIVNLNPWQTLYLFKFQIILILLSFELLFVESLTHEDIADKFGLIYIPPEMSKGTDSLIIRSLDAESEEEKQTQGTIPWLKKLMQKILTWHRLTYNWLIVRRLGFVFSRLIINLQI